MKFIIKSCTTNPGGGIPDWWCKIPFWRCSQLQVQEIVFMADRNLEARRRRRLSICQMMAMHWPWRVTHQAGRPATRLLAPLPSFGR